ncbi:GNAT family N-acetyltransferase [Amnibacterium sp. CER49]|uniref:GNAT family N-acetyltransferase n=1 Tax=Amnibacterium sp. CER49 TaxID=3039161 RepID=UPI00244A7C06|nr:GNAT family N-acetyltransferase [Amnibacterium sp. CER49]MDH2442509.1 GNAT family N-acetyltransferase [Amnibacterium sp. CER49]
MTVTIKPLTERDFFAWYELLLEFGADAHVELSDENVMRIWTRLQTDDAHGVLATDALGKVVGLAHFETVTRLLQGDTATMIEDVYVAQRSRRQGVATALIEHIRTRSEEEHRSSVRWLAKPEDAAAKALFDKFAASTGGWVLHDLPVA